MAKKKDKKVKEPKVVEATEEVVETPVVEVTETEVVTEDQTSPEQEAEAQAEEPSESIVDEVSEALSDFQTYWEETAGPRIARGHTIISVLKSVCSISTGCSYKDFVNSMEDSEFKKAVSNPRANIESIRNIAEKAWEYISPK